MSFNRIRKEQEKNLDELHKARLERCIPVAREVIKLVASKADTVAMGEVDHTHEDYADLAVDIMKMFLEKDINWNDKDFIFQLALQPLTYTHNVCQTSFEQSWNTVLSGLWGKKSADLTFKDLDEKLKKGDEIEDNTQ